MDGLKKLYAELLDSEWKGKKIWEYVRDKQFAIVPCMLGKDISPRGASDPSIPRVMIVGRAVNGWDMPYGDYSSLDKTLENILAQKDSLDDYSKPHVKNKDDSLYYFARSPFIRFMKFYIAKATGKVDDWNKNLIYSNLYKVGPTEKGNPAWALMMKDMNLYVKILEKEIELYKPEIIIFVTAEGFLGPNPKKESFTTLFGEQKNRNLHDGICFTSTLKDDPKTKVVVCKRPERHSNEFLRELAEEIEKFRKAGE